MVRLQLHWLKIFRRPGGLVAVVDLDMEIDRGQIFGLIGPNGAGKSTVLQNVPVGYHLQSPISVAGIFRKTSTYRRQEEDVLEKAFDTLAFTGLLQYADEMAVNLPHGRQRLLALAVALDIQPQLLLLDEPVTGMNAAEVETMLAMIRALREKKGITCIVIEHNLKALMGLCDRIAMLNFGLKIAEGKPAEIVKNPAVMEAYLGTEKDVF